MGHMVAASMSAIMMSAATRCVFDLYASIIASLKLKHVFDRRCLRFVFIQVVNMEFEGGLTAAFTMVAFTEEICLRRTSIYGSKVRKKHYLKLTIRIVHLLYFIKFVLRNHHFSASVSVIIQFSVFQSLTPRQSFQKHYYNYTLLHLYRFVLFNRNNVLFAFQRQILAILPSTTLAHYLIDVEFIINVSSQGELSCNGREVRVFDFLTETSTEHMLQHKAPVAFGLEGHGVADYHLVDAFVNAIAVSYFFFFVLFF